VKIFLLICSIIELFCNLCFSQIKIHKTLGVEDGLIQSTVRVIYKDNQGFMWFGTNLGVSCWDGISFKNFSTTTGLPGHTVYSIKEDRKGNLYLGTSNGVAVYQDGKIKGLETKDRNSHLKIKAIEVSDEGDVYFGSDKGLFILKDQKLEKSAFTDTIKNSDILSSTKDKDGRIYFGTRSRGVFIIEKKKLINVLVDNRLYNQQIESLFYTNNGELVLSSIKDGTFYTWDKSLILKEKHLPILSNVHSICEDNDGILYFGTNEGIFLWKGDKIIDEIKHKNGLNNEKIFSIYKDTDGTMYFGMNSGGVAIVNRYRTINFNEDLGLVSNNVTAIANGNNGELYFGTREQGISIYKNDSFQKLKIDCQQIICAYKSINGKIYFGTDGGVLIIYNEKTYKLTKADGLLSNIITAITGTNDGTIYIGTVKGLNILKNGIIKSITEKDGLGNNLITSLSSNGNGNIYIGTFFNGVTVLRKNKFEIINKDKGLNNNSVFSVYINSDGKLCVGTADGLNIITQDKIDILNTSGGLSDNSINSIIEDNIGRIYLATNRGINVLSFSNGKYNIKLLRSEDGIAGDECNMGAVYKDNKGNLWFGTIKGAVAFDPNKIVPSDIPPQIHISGMYLFDKEVNNFSGTSGEFSYNENFFKFNFQGLLLSTPSRIIYNYRLKGLSDEWFTTNQRSVQFTNLDAGSYTFEVKARNEWGYWSKPETASFSIYPPIWKRWWFIALTLLVIGGTIGYAITRRIQSLLTLERIRLRIAADLHDNIGASLTEISIMSEVVKSKLNDENKEAKKNLEFIISECRNVVSNMRDIIWMINPKQDSLRDLILRLNDSFTQIFDQKGISFKAENMELLKNIILPMEYRQNLYLILKEGINNCLKYSCCTQLILSAKIQKNNLEVVLKDNGVGIPINGNRNGNGLSNLKERAKKIGANLIIESGERNGTSIKFFGKIV
jgi:ligand-binding sensor domain-containing protein/two-component sensor histidine kinase